MDGHEIYTRLGAIFLEVFNEDSIQVTADLSAKDVDGWGSLSHIRPILTVEKAFKIKFTTSEVGKLERVGDLVALIRRGWCARCFRKRWFFRARRSFGLAICFTQQYTFIMPVPKKGVPVEKCLV